MMRPALLVPAAALLFAVWIFPLPQSGLAPFTAHMLRHMSVIVFAAPLIVAGWPALAQVPLPVLAATLIEFAVVWLWHLPVLHEAASISTLVYTAEQASFLAAGLLLWASVMRSGEQLAGAGGLLLTSMHMTLLGALLTLAPRPLYDAVCFGADPLGDQQTGGMIMLAVGTPVYLVAGLWLVRGALDGEAEERA